MLRIDIATIPTESQRYKTLGDYYAKYSGGLIFDVVAVSDMGNRYYEFLIALHEVVEMCLCQKRGIKEEDITAFDVAFDKDGEPGDDPRAPYFKEHQFATTLEKMMCAELGIDWDVYNQFCDQFFKSTYDNSKVA
jgi:hypothetical protein